MADGVAITAGSGTTIATDDAGAAGHVQIVKLAEASNGSAAVYDLGTALANLLSAVDGVESSLSSLLTELGQKLEAADLSSLATAANQSTANTSLSTIATAVGTLDNAISGSEMQVDVVGALPAGTNNIGDVDVLTLPALPAGTNAIGTVDLASTTPVQFLDVDETEDEVKSSAGKLHGYFLANLSAGARYVKFYDGAAAAVTVGTTTPKLTIPLAAGEKANLALPRGLTFAAGICVAATTGFAVADTGAPGTNDIIANVFYS